MSYNGGMKLNPILSSATVAIALAFTCGLWSAVPSSFATQGDNFDLQGTIHAQSKDKLTIDSGGGIYFHVVYDDKTVIVGADGKSATEDALKVGVVVHVVGDLDETGQVKAQRIEIKAPAGKDAPPPSALAVGSV